MGIDPGLANTGIGVVKYTSSGYTLVDHKLIKTASKDTEAARYHQIAERIEAAIATHAPDLVAVESVFYNRNVSSAITTAGVIAVCLLIAERTGIPSTLLKPQTAKAACGLGGKASKERMIGVAERLFGVKFKKSESHVADAIFVAMAGILEGKRYGSKGI